MRIGYEALNVQIPNETKEQLEIIRADIGIRTLTDTLIIVIDAYHLRMGAQAPRKQREQDNDE